MTPQAAQRAAKEKMDGKNGIIKFRNAVFSGA
jgi:hypothetical protein